MPSTRVYAIAALAATASAFPVERRQDSIGFTTTCDAAKTPDFNDCTSALTMLSDQANNDASYSWAYPSAGNTVSYTVGNCVATIAFFNGQPIQHNIVVDGFDTLLQQCAPAQAGGNASLDPDGVSAVSLYAPGNPPPGKTKRAHEVTKRQDNTWSNAYTINNATPSQFWQQVLQALPGGSSWVLTDTETQTNMVQSTTTISGDLFSIISASESITYSYTDTVTSTSTQTIVNNCSNDQEGYLYWTPLFTQYHGGFSAGPSPLDVYVPMTDSEGNAAGNYVVQCSG